MPKKLKIIVLAVLFIVCAASLIWVVRAANDSAASSDEEFAQLKGCSVDADCFVADSCLGCNVCYSKDPAVIKGVDCEAKCHQDPLLGCRCVDGKCKTIKNDK